MGRTVRLGIISSVILVFLLGCVSSAWASVESRVVVMTGQPVPGGGVQTVSSLYSSDYGIRGGTVAVRGRIGTSDYALWGMDTAGNLKFTAIHGQAIPGMASQRYNSFDFALINSDGSVLAVARTSPTDTALPNQMLIEFTGNSVQALLQNKTPAPGAPGATLYTVNSLAHAYAKGGGFITQCQLSDAASGTEFGMWSNVAGNGVELIARKDSPAPGSNGAYNLFDYYPSIAPGIAIFHGWYRENSVNKFGMWKATAGGVSPVVLAGMAAPDSNGNTFTSASRATLNDAGQFALQGNMPYVNLQMPIHGIFKDTGNGLHCVLSTTMETPGLPGGRMMLFDDPTIDDYGYVAFGGHLHGSANTAIVWSEGLTGSLHIVARQGQAVEGLDGRTFSNFSNVTMNSAGQVAFLTYLGPDGYALLAEDAQGQLKLVACEGQELITPAGLRTIDSLQFSDGSDGAEAYLNAQSFDADGTLVYFATFTDGSSAILTAEVPEPVTASLLALGVLGMLRRRRK